MLKKKLFTAFALTALSTTAFAETQAPVQDEGVVQQEYVVGTPADDFPSKDKIFGNDLSGSEYFSFAEREVKEDGDKKKYKFKDAVFKVPADESLSQGEITISLPTLEVIKTGEEEIKITASDVVKIKSGVDNYTAEFKKEPVIHLKGKESSNMNFLVDVPKFDVKYDETGKSIYSGDKFYLGFSGNGKGEDIESGKIEFVAKNLLSSIEAMPELKTLPKEDIAKLEEILAKHGASDIDVLLNFAANEPNFNLNFDQFSIKNDLYSFNIGGNIKSPEEKVANPENMSPLGAMPKIDMNVKFSNFAEAIDTNLEYFRIIMPVLTKEMDPNIPETQMMATMFNFPPEQVDMLKNMLRMISDEPSGQGKDLSISIKNNEQGSVNVGTLPGEQAMMMLMSVFMPAMMGMGAEGGAMGQGSEEVAPAQ